MYPSEILGAWTCLLAKFYVREQWSSARHVLMRGHRKHFFLCFRSFHLFAFDLGDVFRFVLPKSEFNLTL